MNHRYIYLAAVFAVALGGTGTEARSQDSIPQSTAAEQTEDIVYAGGTFWTKHETYGKIFIKDIWARPPIDTWITPAFDVNDPEAIRQAIEAMGTVRGDPNSPATNADARNFGLYIASFNHALDLHDDPALIAEIQAGLLTEFLQASDSLPMNRRADWTRIDLSGVDLGGKDLTGFNGLNGSQLQKASNLVGANMVGVPFLRPPWEDIWASYAGPSYWDGSQDHHANMNGRDLSGVNLSNANFSRGYRDAAQSNFTGAILRGVDFSGTFDAGAYSNFSGADLTGASFAGHRGNGFASNFTGANLTNVDFSARGIQPDSHPGFGPNGNYNGWAGNFTNATLTGADFTGNNMTWSSWNGVISGGVKGGDKNLGNGWHVRGGYIVGPRVNLTNANLSGVNLSGVDLNGVLSSGVTVDSRTVLPEGWSVEDGVLVGPPGTEYQPPEPTPTPRPV